MVIATVLLDAIVLCPTVFALECLARLDRRKRLHSSTALILMGAMGLSLLLNIMPRRVRATRGTETLPDCFFVNEYGWLCSAMSQGISYDGPMDRHSTGGDNSMSVRFDPSDSSLVMTLYNKNEIKEISAVTTGRRDFDSACAMGDAYITGMFLLYLALFCEWIHSRREKDLIRRREGRKP